MFVKPKSEATPDTQHLPESVGEYIIGTGIVDGVVVKPEETLAPAVSVPTGEQISEELEKTREFEALKEQKKAREKKRSVGRRIMTGALVFVALLLVAAAAGSVMIMEPWVEPEPQEVYTGPEQHTLEPMTLSVGEIYPLKISLLPNEKIASVDIEDGDVLAYGDDMSVSALGEYFKTTVTVVTREISVPVAGYEKDIVVFGKDVTEEYYAYRSWLRDRFDLEPISAPRTELHDLCVYTQEFSIAGIPHANMRIPGQIEATKFFDVAVDMDHDIGLSVKAVSADSSIAIVTPWSFEQKQCDFTITGVRKGDTTVTATIGFWKQVTPEVYAEYLATLEDPGDPSLRENEIFVAQRDITYSVSIKDKALRYYWYRGRKIYF